MNLAHAVKWSFLSELAAKVIQPIVFIALVRLLTPEDFGVMSAALMVIGFSQIFWEAGMGKALIQRQTDTEDAALVAFWINIGLGILISGFLFIAAGSIADTFFQDGRVTAVLRVMTIQVFLGALSSVQIALLQKEMGFRKLFWVRFATVSLPALASVPLAWNGMGYWALVFGTLVGQAAQVVILWRVSSWRPRWSFQVQVAREMGRFGAWVGVSGLLTWFYVWADSLIVGMHLGSHELGLYRTGNQFAMMIFAILFGSITPVLYSHLSRMDRDKERMRNATEKVIKALIFMAIPVAMILFSLATPIGDALFGGKWEGIGFVIGVMALMHGVSWVVGINGEVYRAMGMPSYETIVTAFSLIIYLPVYLFSIRFGLEVFVWTRLALASSSLLLHLFVVKRLLSMPILPLLKLLLVITVTCGILVSLVQYVFTSNITGSWWQILTGGVASVVVVAGALFVIGKNGVLKDIVSIIRVHSA